VQGEGRTAVFDADFIELIIGAAFHDLGKVWLRTGHQDIRQRARQYCQAPQPHADFSSCPHCRREFGYLHALLGYIAVLELIPEPWRNGAAALVAAHHRAGGLGRSPRVLMVADRLSAAERVEAEEAEAGNRQLRSLLTDISPEGPVSPQTPCYFPLRPLAVDRAALMPGPALSTGAEAAYDRIWAGLTRTLKALCRAVGPDSGPYLAGLFTALQLYLWSVPSAYYRDSADISLFEHLRTTAALAAALDRSGVSEAVLDRALAANDYSALSFDLIGGDVSGVQAFLYTLTSRAVARGLRGRSFYLDMVTELSARWVLRQLGLPVCNLLYAGGGRFYVLSHPVPDEEFDRLRAELAEAFLAKFEGQLYLALARVRLSGSDVKTPDRYTEKWSRELGAELARAKERRFANAGPGLFTPAGGGPPEQICAVCGREGADRPLPDDPERRQCGVCADLAELGRELADARGIILVPAGPENPPGRLWPFLGYRLEVVDSFERVRPEPGTVLYVLNPDAGQLGRLLELFGGPGPKPAVSWRFLPQAVPRLGPDARPDDGEHPLHIADFGRLAARAEGANLLGILRLDVDNLGRIFGRGLGQRATPARYSTLSFLLRLYFEGVVSLICQALDREPGALYLLYSGGDDLFVVGAWDLIPKLALKIREEFGAFTGNPALTLSAGIYLADHHWPLYQTAEAARKALEAAKGRRVDGRRAKDGVNFLGRTFGWEEFRQLAAEAYRLKGLVAAEPLPAENRQPGRVLLHRLMGLYRLEEQDRGRIRRPNGRPHYGPWVWRAVYYLARLADLYRQEELRELARTIHNDPGRLEIYAYEARWAELLTRKEVPI
jgi:CRISPR-associated protein Csm1